MDLGIRGRKAIVCAASKGLGKACATSLAREGVDLVINSRNIDVLAATAEAIAAETGVSVTPVAADITTEAGRASVLDACPDPDILVNNAGGPPPGDFREWDREVWIRALDGNMLSAIFMIRATVDRMIERKFGRIVNVTSSTVKAPLYELGLSNGARAGLTGFIAGLARQTVPHNVTINNLLPGPFLTDRIIANTTFRAEQAGKTFDEMLDERKAENPAKRIGDPAEFGDACAYLCSAQAGFITGQNLLMDGGHYHGTL